MKLREIIIALLLVSAFAGVGISYGKFYLFHLIFLIVLGYCVANRKSMALPKLKGYSMVYPLALLAFFSLSVLWTPETTEGLKYLIYMIIACGILYLPQLLVTSKLQLKRAISMIAILSALEILIGLLEYFSSFRYPISPYSHNVTLFNRKYSIPDGLASESIEILHSTPTGFHWNPNNFATVMLILIPFFIYAKNWWIKLSGVLSCTFLIFVSNSRTAIFALIVVLIICFIQSFRINKKGFIYSVGALVTILAIVLNFTTIGGIISTKFRSSTTAVNVLLFEYQTDNNSIGVRQKIIRNAFTEISENHFLGSGIGASKYSQIKHGKSQGKITSIHNYWLEILVDGGILIFFSFMLWYIILIRDLGRYTSKSDGMLKPLAKACLAALMGCILMGFSVSSFTYFLPFWVLISISLMVLKFRAYPETTLETPPK